MARARDRHRGGADRLSTGPLGRRDRAPGAREPRARRPSPGCGIVTADGPPIDVALVAHADRIAVELDAWYHFHDPEGYRRDRVQDARLARAGYFVLRFPAEDVDDRLVSTIEHLAIALAGRRAARALL